MVTPTAPGVYPTITAAAPSTTLPSSTGTWFVTGEAAQGPTGLAVPLGSMADYANFLGARSGYTTLYDSLDEFFHDGGSLAYVSRVVGPAAVAATLSLSDHSSVATLSVTANGAGVWGNSCTVAVAAGAPSNSYVITIVNTLTGQTWVSPTLFTPADAVTWATNLAGTTPWTFPFVIANLGSATTPPGNNPAVIAATNLATGADDISGITETQWTTALTAFSSSYGPGQVSAPGHNTQLGWEALISHASATDPQSGALINNRFALLDDVDSATASTIVSAVQEAQAGSGDSSFSMFLAPWVIIPGVPAATIGSSPSAATRTVPPSSLVAALMARNDASNNAGVPAAGPNGLSTFAVGVTQTYVEADRGTLNSAGVSVIRNFIGAVQLYGYVTAATNPAWTSASMARMRMELVNAVTNVAQNFAFAQIDGQGHLLSHFAGALSGVCQTYWQQGALYGSTAASAYTVNVSSSVNTPATLAAGQLNASIAVRFSPYAEFVLPAITAYPITQSLPA